VTETRAFWIAAPGRGEIRPAALAPPGRGEALVRALESGISRGTEALVFRGEVPAGLAASMRCPFQEGSFPGPVKYGYCMVGEVEEGPGDLVGRRVFCLHPHQERFVVPADALLPVPDGVPTARAVLAANMETAVNILWDAPPTVGSRVAVVGAGVVGCLAAWLAARVPGTRVELIDVEGERARTAERLGVAFAAPDAAQGGCDLVIHASGNPAGLSTALALAGFEAMVVEASWYGDRPVPAPLGAWFHPGRLRLVSSQVGTVAASMRPRHGHRDRLALALRLLEDPRLDALLTGTVAFDALPAAMEELARTPGGTLCRRVLYATT
jgi:threonine dehydrogenase-like Zn-dependent dehydrogenase